MVCSLQDSKERELTCAPFCLQRPSPSRWASSGSREHPPHTRYRLHRSVRRRRKPARSRRFPWAAVGSAIGDPSATVAPFITARPASIPVRSAKSAPATDSAQCAAWATIADAAQAKPSRLRRLACSLWLNVELLRQRPPLILLLALERSADSGRAARQVRVMPTDIRASTSLVGQVWLRTRRREWAR